MSFTRLRLWYLLPFALLALVALVPAGCGPDDGVGKNVVPKSTEPTLAGSLDTGPYRILGAMFPADKPQWFFKLAGPADALTPHVDGFDKLIASVSLPANGDVPEYTLPEGWTRGEGREMVAATVKTPDGKHEVTITSAQGSVQENLKRWATGPTQLGNASFTGGDVRKYTKTFEANGVTGLRADLRGPNDPLAKKGGPFMGGGGKLPPNHP